jgi:hypothetical protein
MVVDQNGSRVETTKQHFSLAFARIKLRFHRVLVSHLDSPVFAGAEHAAHL